MSEEFKVEIVNPEKSFLTKDDATEVVVPAFEGEMGILKDHISIISFLKPGVVKVYSKSDENKYFVEDGIVEFKDNSLSILTSSIYNVSDLDRNKIISSLNQEGIPSMVYYKIPVHLQKGYEKYGYSQGDFPVSEKISNKILSLPMHPYLKKEDQDKIINAINNLI